MCPEHPPSAQEVSYSVLKDPNVSETPLNAETSRSNYAEKATFYKPVYRLANRRRTFRRISDARRNRRAQGSDSGGPKVGSRSA